MTEKVSDVVSQLEAVIADIRADIKHGDECATTYMRWRCAECGEKSPHGNACDCDYATRVGAAIARTVERMLEAACATYDPHPPAFDDTARAAAFRATQEQETQK